MNSVVKYFTYLLRKHIFSWRVLAVAIISVMIMDAFMAPVRLYSKAMDIKMTQWGFALIWNNKYIVLCFMLLFIFAASAFPEDRVQERYLIARLGISKWVWGQALVIFHLDGFILFFFM